MAQTIATLAVRVEKLEKDTGELFEKVNDARETQAGINEKLSAMLTTLGEVKQAVTEIQRRPGKLWDILLGAVVAAVVSGTVATIIKF